MSDTAADILVLGKIFTADPQMPFAEAMAIRDGRILFTGSLRDAEAFCSGQTVRLERSGLIVPGMTEGHAHVTCASEMILGVALGHEDCPEGYLRRIRDWYDAHPDASSIFGSGYDNGVFGPQGPSSSLLDSVSAKIPIVMIASDHHSRWLNTRAMELAGITDSTPDPINGEIVRDSSGHATGWLKETAMLLANPAIEPISPEVYAEAVRYYQRIALENGITNVFEPMFDSLRDYEARAEGYRLLDRSGELFLTARLGWSIEADEDFSSAFPRMQETRRRLSDCRNVRLTTAKFFIDGVVECHTAYLREPYSDSAARGEATMSAEMLKHRILSCMQDGFDIHAHVIGDAAADLAIDACEYGQLQTAPFRPDGFRNALTHLQLVAPDAVERISSLGLSGVINPYWHYYSPVYYDELELPFLGRKRAEEEYPMKTLLDAGIPLSQASDFPVTIPPRTMDSLHLMVNRREPGLENAIALNEGECISLSDALIILTIGGARQLRLEETKGSLTAGKDADFVVLSPDPFSLPTECLWKTEVSETYIAGILRYSRV